MRAVSALWSVKCTVWPTAQTCQTTANSLLLVIILLTVDPSRGPRSELSPYFSEYSTIYVHSDLIVEYLVIVMLNFQNSRYVKFMILLVVLPLLSNLLV